MLTYDLLCTNFFQFSLTYDLFSVVLKMNGMYVGKKKKTTC